MDIWLHVIICSEQMLRIKFLVIEERYFSLGLGILVRGYLSFLMGHLLRCKKKEFGEVNAGKSQQLRSAALQNAGIGGK